MSTDSGEAGRRPAPSEAVGEPAVADESPTRPQPAVVEPEPAAEPVTGPPAASAAAPPPPPGWTPPPGTPVAPPGWRPPRRPWRSYASSRPLQLVVALIVGFLLGAGTVGVAAVAFHHDGVGVRPGPGRFDNRRGPGFGQGGPFQGGPRNGRRLQPPGQRRQPGVPRPAPSGSTPSVAPTT